MKRKQKYGDYVEYLNGKMYASVQIPTESGKYIKKRKRVSTKHEAKQWAEAILQKLVIPTTVTTFTQLRSWYKSMFLVPPVYSKSGKKVSGCRTWKNQRGILDSMTFFDHYDINKITVDTLLRYRTMRLKTVSIASTNKEFTILRTMFIKAFHRGWLQRNPFQQGEKLIDKEAESRRVSQLTTRMVKRLLARSRKQLSKTDLHYAIYLAACTGGRPSELYLYKGDTDDVVKEPLTWEQIVCHDFQAVTLISYKGRTRRERVVPTTVGLERALRELYAARDPALTDRVLNYTTYQTSWNTLLKSLGYNNVRMRDLRHYFNSYLVSRPDINDMERMLLMDHKEISTNAIYSKLDPAFAEKFRK